MKLSPGFLPHLFIMVGGFTGAVLRFLIDEQLPSLAGTLAVNIAGCFLMGVFM